MSVIINNLKKRYNNFELNIPDIFIKKGEVFGLVGNNGAGKTTFLRLCVDLIQSCEGRIYLKNIDVSKDEKWKDFTGTYLDERFLIDFLTAEEYFQFVASLHDMDKKQTIDSLNHHKSFFAGQIIGTGKYIREMSTGNKQKTGITAAMLFKPDILILDEPFSNLDPTSRQTLVGLLNRLKEENNTTILMSSHDLTNVTDVCTRISILDDGKIIQDSIVSDTTIHELYEYFKNKTVYKSD